MKKWFKIISEILGILLLFALGLALFSWFRFGPLALFGHEGITITLPYGVADEPGSMLPLGEKEEVHPDGHPGIDFQWNYAAPLIATNAGTITGISKAEDEGEPVLYVMLTSGEYTSTYKELDAVGPGITKGAKVTAGDLIGYPHCTYFADSGGHTGCQLHWEFGYASFPGSTRLCPLTYFDSEALIRINALWDKTKPSHKNPTGQMICNGDYDGKDQRIIPTLKVGMIVKRGPLVRIPPPPPVGKWLARYAGSPADFRRKIEFCLCLVKRDARSGFIEELLR